MFDKNLSLDFKTLSGVNLFIKCQTTEERINQIFLLIGFFIVLFIVLFIIGGDWRIY